MARISSFTVFLFITLVAYTILSAGIFSTVTGGTFSNPYGGMVEKWEYSAEFQNSEGYNLTKGETHIFSTLSPDIKVIWYHNPIDFLNPHGRFDFLRQGVNWWDGWYHYEMAGSRIYAKQVIDEWNPSKGFSKYVLDQGGTFEVHCFIYPLMDDEGNWAYNSLRESIENNKVTMILGTNATYPTFDIGLILGVATGFTAYGTPFIVSVLIAGIWWILFLLAVIKLVIG